MHDLHAWTLTSGMSVATVHLVLTTAADPQTVLMSAQKVLREQHHGDHATLQVESSPTKECLERAW